jgi:filamentous hemagglutinin
MPFFAQLLKRGGVQTLDGSFSIWNWEGYPTNIPKPKGPFRLLQGEEYAAARAAANNANKAISKELGLQGKFVDIHEIVPVKFGGSPTNINNKIFLDRTFHQSQVTPFWNKIMNGLQ